MFSALRSLTRSTTTAASSSQSCRSLSTALTRATTSTSAFPTLSLFAAASPLALAVQQRSMKVMQTLKKRCEHCYIVRRGTIRYVYCKVNPRHKARNGPKRRAGWLHKRAYK